MTGQADWIWYGLGVLLGVIALGLGAWAILWDRAGGRLRCPRCWYAMGGTPRTHDESGGEVFQCPECGRKTWGEQRLRKTRRRWRWACISLAVGYAAMQSALVPTPGRDGWWRFVPTCVLALTADYRDWGHPSTDRLSTRLVSGFVFPWDREFTRQLELRELPRDWSRVVLARDRWPVGTPLRVAIDRSKQQWLWSIGEWRSLEMAPADAQGPSAIVYLSPQGSVVHGWGDEPPDFVDLVAPAAGENIYAVDLALKVGDRVVARRRVEFEVEGVSEIGDVVSPVKPSPNQQFGPTLDFSTFSSARERGIWVSEDLFSWNPASFTRRFQVKLWLGETLLGQAALGDNLFGARIAMDFDNEIVSGLLREDGQYLDISGMRLEIAPDELAALQDLRRSRYSSESLIMPLAGLPFSWGSEGGQRIRLRGAVIPLTDRPPEEWLRENGVPQDGG